MTGNAQGGILIAHDEEFTIGVVMGIMAGGAMDVAVAVGMQLLRDGRGQFRIGQGLVVVERYRMVVGDVRVQIASPVGGDFHIHGDAAHRPQHIAQGDGAVMTAEAETGRAGGLLGRGAQRTALIEQVIGRLQILVP